MSLTPGVRIGAYEILSLIGAGGMGEVYRARDTRLGRDVAIKILPELFATDADRLARFKREAQILASLNHQHIAAIYGLEETANVSALVLELVEGPTLADRIAQGPIPLDEALPIAKQIAEALEVAHEHGIVHRDLKPANIKLTLNGNVKVLDFGLAKAFEPTGGADVSQSPTITSPAMTAGGIILGTAAYMSPEQARGKVVDKRADMWAFGCVLYEMLTARQAFKGEGVSDTLAEVLKSDPDWRAVSDEVPEPILRLLRRCLTKDPRSRLSDAAVARLEIDDASTPTRETTGTLVPHGALKQARLAWTIAAASLLLAMGTVALSRFRAIPDAAPITRFTVSLPTGWQMTGSPMVPTVSPDGRHIAYMSVPAGGGRGEIEIWMRALDSLSPRPIPGVNPRSLFPFWSPDSAQLGFFSDWKLKKIAPNGGAPETVSDAQGAIGGTWSRNGIILFGSEKGIFRVSAAAGEPQAVTHVKPGATGEIVAAHVFPQFLPDGRHFIYLSLPENAIHLAALDSTDTRELLKADSQALFVPPGHLFFVRQQTLLVQPFDPDRRELSGSPVEIATQIAVLPEINLAGFSASENGVLVYRGLQGAARPTSKLVWVNREGHKVGEIPGDFDDRQVSLSRATPFLALDRFEGILSATRDLWIVDHRRGTSTRLTSDPSDECCPVWAPDGTRLVFPSSRDGQMNLYETSPDSVDPPRLLLKTPFDKFPKDWSRDSQFIAYESQSGDGNRRDLWLLPLAGNQTPIAVVRTRADESSGRFSPNGKWIAYVSDQSGRYEVYVQSLVDRGRRRLQVSTDGGFYPRWRDDGRELFYASADRKLTAVAVEEKGTELQLGLPKALFEMPISDPAAQQFTDKYDVTADGQRFILFQTANQTMSVDLTVVVNWPGAFKIRD